MCRPFTANTAELETIWKLNFCLTLNGWLRRAISLVFAWRYKIQNYIYYGMQGNWRFTPKGKNLWKMKRFASHQHDIQCCFEILNWLAEEDIMNVSKCWYRVIICQLIIFVAKRNNVYFLYGHCIYSLWREIKLAPSNYTLSIFVWNSGDRLLSGK